VAGRNGGESEPGGEDTIGGGRKKGIKTFVEGLVNTLRHFRGKLEKRKAAKGKKGDVV